MKTLRYDLVIDKDGSVRTIVAALYNKIVNTNNSDICVCIKMPLDNWISVFSLSYILVFIQAVKNFSISAQFEIELFSEEDMNKVVSTGKDGTMTKLFKRMKQKIRFYESMEFIERLNDLGVDVFPRKTLHDKLTSILDAKKIPLTHQYSARILSLRPLIDNEAEQHELSFRMNTLTNILYNKFYNKKFAGYQDISSNIDPKTLKTFSSKIMYELVKNIYQHSTYENRSTAITMGFACAQIYPHQLIMPKINKDLINALLSVASGELVDGGVKYLGISINDWGDGIINRVKQFFLKYGDSEKQYSEEELLKLAVTTDFSSRLDYLPQESDQTDCWKLDEKHHLPLEPKGYGFIYAIGFLALTYGKMSIRTERYEMTISVKLDAIRKIKNDTELWKNTIYTSELLTSSIDKYFLVKLIEVSKDLAEFPGTQILIEIPIIDRNINIK